MSTLSQDPRSDHPSLTPRDKRRLFEQHLSTLHRKRVSAIENLFSENAPALDTPFHDVLPKINDSPHVARLFGDDFNALEDLYSSWQSRRAAQAKDEFYQLLKESPILEHWGRLKKMEKREDVKLIGEEGTRNDESDDEETGVRDMADQVDIKAVHATLKVSDTCLTFFDSELTRVESAERQAILDLESRAREARRVDRRLRREQAHGTKDDGPPTRLIVEALIGIRSFVVFETQTRRPSAARSREVRAPQFSGHVLRLQSTLLRVGRKARTKVSEVSPPIPQFIAFRGKAPKLPREQDGSANLSHPSFLAHCAISLSGLALLGLAYSPSYRLRSTSRPEGRDLCPISCSHRFLDLPASCVTPCPLFAVLAALEREQHGQECRRNHLRPDPRRSRGQPVSLARALPLLVLHPAVLALCQGPTESHRSATRLVSSSTLFLWVVRR